MINRIKILVKFAMLIVVMAGLLLTVSNGMADDIGPIKFKCDDGRAFTITYIKEKSEVVPMKAQLVFENNNAVEILKNDRMGSGISYSNGKYSYHEHQGVSQLIDYSKSKNGFEVMCHQVK